MAVLGPDSSLPTDANYGLCLEPFSPTTTMMNEDATDGGLNLTPEIAAIIRKPGYLGHHDGGQRLRQLYIAGEFVNAVADFFFLTYLCQNGDTLIQRFYPNLECFVVLDNYWRYRRYVIFLL